MILLKILVILSGGTALITRLFAYENKEVLNEITASGLNTVGIIAAAVCLLSGIALGLILKKKQKKETEEKDDEKAE